MPPRIVCPHCHAPIDPRLLDTAECAGTPCRVCPECDGMIVLPCGGDPLTEAAPFPHEDAPAILSVVEETV